MVAEEQRELYAIAASLIAAAFMFAGLASIYNRQWHSGCRIFARTLGTARARMWSMPPWRSRMRFVRMKMIPVHILQSIRFLIGMMSFEDGLALINEILPADDYSGWRHPR